MGKRRKSSFSNGSGGSNCVQVERFGPDDIVITDSKNPENSGLSFTQAEWDAFVAGVKAGEFDGV